MLIIAGSRGLSDPEGTIEVVVSETAAPDEEVVVALVEEDSELWSDVGWEEELDPLVEVDDNP